ncbi:multicopper oxidase family protein [Arenimonas oryziterrae]|uniref:Copper oxidase n=1 Tax=Arenimonas oryziterrae DSM 21050 = YC6267 TaxID=1121015 RepID=A0A091AUQ8_9GAMM|nr:copper oxidase [Arenimonas oryziterrae]KFN42962.1 hypothetical protein N789_12625 [Arenimonas oryziterrae DSM 21050 = YC6267]
MTVTRRNLLIGTGAGLLATAVANVARAQHEGHDMRNMPPPAAARPSTPGARGRVVTPNGWTLPHRMNNGVKEFHLVAEEFEHEFAPGTTAKVWGYNGSTPGPTIEATEGDRVRIYVTNRLKEHTSVHWHGLLLPSGMDGVGGLSQPHIQPGETYAYEFTLRQHGTHMYHPHADEMTQLALGMMGMFIIHPKDGEAEAIDRDYAILLHNWALHPGTYRPDPSILQDFDLWTMNSKVFPAIDSLTAVAGERVRIRLGNLSMWNHPMHLHGHVFQVTGSDGGRWPKGLWRPEVTEIVGVGQTRDIEFVATPGDWAFHCHMSHHTMNAMGHELPNTVGVNQRGVEEKIRQMLPGYMAMGENGMAEHQDHTDAGHMPGPPNTLPMMMGSGPFGKLEMGGMFTVLKVRESGAHSDWYQNPAGTVARRVSSDPGFGQPPRRQR